MSGMGSRIPCDSGTQKEASTPAERRGRALPGTTLAHDFVLNPLVISRVKIYGCHILCVKYDSAASQ